MTFPDPAESAGYVLWKLNHAMQLRMTEALAGMGLTLSQLGSLIHIARGDAVSSADLARVLLMTPQNMGLTTKQLVERGLLIRRPHETHGRIHRLELTKAGARTLAAAIDELRKVEDEVFEGVSLSGRRTLVGQLRAALKRLKDREGES